MRKKGTKEEGKVISLFSEVSSGPIAIFLTERSSIQRDCAQLDSIKISCALNGINKKRKEIHIYTTATISTSSINLFWHFSLLYHQYQYSDQKRKKTKEEMDRRGKRLISQPLTSSNYSFIS